MNSSKKHKLLLGVVSGATILTMGLSTLSANAAGSGACASRDKVIEALSDVYSEQPVSLGLTDAGAVIEVMASVEGSFTIVITHPNGLTCPIAAGKAWHTVAEKVKGEGA